MRAGARHRARPSIPRPVRGLDCSFVVIRPCRADELEAILAIVNQAAEAYRGVIPADRWREPYMPRPELDEAIAAGVAFWGCEIDGELVGVMGIQPVADVELIRHAYVLPARQGLGVGGALLEQLMAPQRPAGAGGDVGGGRMGDPLLPPPRVRAGGGRADRRVCSDATGRSPSARSRPRSYWPGLRSAEELKTASPESCR